MLPRRGVKRNARELSQLTKDAVTAVSSEQAEVETLHVQAKKQSAGARNLNLVLDQIRKEDEIVTKIQLDLIDERIRLKALQKRQATLLKGLECANAEVDASRSRIRIVEASWKQAQKKMNQLRFWGAGMELIDVPDELLRFIFLYIGYEHQQRLVRVCRLWKHTITRELDHIYVDATQTNDRSGHPRHGRDRRTGPVPPVTGDLDTSTVWKYKCRGVTQLTCNGWSMAHLDTLACSMAQLAPTFPNLATVNLVQAVCQATDDPYHPGGPWSLLPSTVRLALHACLVPVIPSVMHRCYTENLTPITQKVRDCYVRVPDFVWTSREEYGRIVDRAVWPYPPVQADWLARWAPSICRKRRFGKGSVTELTRVMASRSESFTSSENKPCQQHGQFCEHLDGSFYMEQMDGQVRNLLAHCLLHLKVRDMDPPPVAFVVQKYEFTGWHRVPVDKTQ